MPVVVCGRFDRRGAGGASLILEETGMVRTKAVQFWRQPWTKHKDGNGDEAGGGGLAGNVDLWEVDKRGGRGGVMG